MGQSPYATNIAAGQLRYASINMNAGVPGSPLALLAGYDPPLHPCELLAT